MIRLSCEETDFLLKVLELPQSLLENLEQIQNEGGSLGDDDADALRDLCGERLQTHGFGPDYRPTEEGKKLEKMIDRLFVG